MSDQQIKLFILFGLLLGFLLWGRYRHDLVAACGLMTAVLLGLVPSEQAFSGFSNPAVIVVALVLVASRAFENSGALALVARGLIREGRGVAAHIMVVGGIGAALSMVINNVAALALLMPVDMKAARAAGRPPSQTLMPLAFATILGGMVTLIGTPSNIIAAGIREERLGRPYDMFDFAPVGLVVALIGITFVALGGWRLIVPRADPLASISSTSSFKAELLVPPESQAVGRMVAELDTEAERADMLVLGVVRDGQTTRGRARRMILQADDVLLVEGATEAIAEFIKLLGLQDAETRLAPAENADATADDADAQGSDAVGERNTDRPPRAGEPQIVEAVVRTDSRLAGRSAAQMGLRNLFGVTVLGISRAGALVGGAVRDQVVAPGDLLLLSGAGAGRQATLDQIGLIAIDRTSVAPVKPRRIVLVVGLFAAAIIAAATGYVSFTIAIAIAVAAFAAFNLVPAREFYQQIEWPVVVMLACLLPIGDAFDRVGGTSLLSGAIADVTAGQPAVVTLVVLMVITMTLSDVLNNLATMVIAGPLAIELARTLGVNPDTFLMGTAIAASCAFLTPIGHKNNTLIMGPGGYRFADYWRIGLPLELVVLAVGVPALLVVWPL